MRLAVISLGGRSSRAVLKEAEPYFRETFHMDIRNIEIRSSNKGSKVFYKGEELEEFDCIYVRGSYKYLLIQESLTKILFNKAYMPLEAKSFSLCHNKLLTTIALQQNRVNVPGTYLTATVDTAKALLDKVNYPIIMKLPAGTQGKGVMFADSAASAKSIIDTLDVVRQPFIIQEFIDTDATDIRAIVAGNKVIASMKKKTKKGDVRANVQMGDVVEACKLDDDTEQLAINAARAVGAEICGVDILQGLKPVVIEINISPALSPESGISRAVKRNVAKDIAVFLYERTKEYKKSKEVGTTEMVKRLDEDKKEIIANIDIKAGIIRLPQIVNKITGFIDGEEVSIKTEKGKVVVER